MPMPLAVAPGAGWGAPARAPRSWSPTNTPEIPMTRRRAVARRRAVSGRIIAGTIPAADALISAAHRSTIARRRATGLVVQRDGGDRAGTAFTRGPRSKPLRGDR